MLNGKRFLKSISDRKESFEIGNSRKRYISCDYYVFTTCCSRRNHLVVGHSIHRCFFLSFGWTHSRPCFRLLGRSMKLLASLFSPLLFWFFGARGCFRDSCSFLLDLILSVTRSTKWLPVFSVPLGLCCSMQLLLHCRLLRCRLRFLEGRALPCAPPPGRRR